jgi:molybdate transport system regulatory protein
MTNDNNQAIFGDGIAKLLEEIEKHHSILKASQSLGMSYRYALHRITLSEERLGESLVTRVRGGAKGGGSSEVTEYGKTLVARFRKAQLELNQVLKSLP